MFALGLAACGEPGVSRVDDVAPLPEGMTCEPTATLPCIERPMMALAMPPTGPGGAQTLVVGGEAGQLFLVAPSGAEVRADALGFVRGGAFSDLDRLMPCDPEGDGQVDILYSQIDAFDPGYRVLAPLGASDVFGVRMGQRRHQAARCIDVDADGRDDLVGLISGAQLGVAHGQSWGLADGVEAYTVPSISSSPDSADLWKVVTSAAGDVDLDGLTDWIWTTRGSSVVRMWALDAAAVEVAEFDPVETELAIERIDLVEVDGDGAPDLVVTGRAKDDGAVISVRLGDGVGGFAAGDSLEVAEPTRRISFADVDDDGDDEFIVVGGWADGVSVVDYSGGALEVIESIPVLANDAVALRFDADDRWDLAILHADTWHVEVLRDAFAPLRH